MSVLNLADLEFKHFSYRVLEKETFENFFAKSAKEEGQGVHKVR